MFDVNNVFRYHTPKADQPQRYEALRGEAKELGKLIEIMCPESREKSLAFTHLQSCIMFANASIAINESEQIGGVSGLNAQSLAPVDPAPPSAPVAA